MSLTCAYRMLLSYLADLPQGMQEGLYKLGFLHDSEGVQHAVAQKTDAINTHLIGFARLITIQAYPTNDDEVLRVYDT